MEVEVTLKKSSIYGLILMGGESSRMGIDKSQITYHDKPHYQHLYDLLTPFCQAVFLSCNETQYTTIPDNYPKLKDKHPNEGPISGLKAAFNFKTTNWLVVPVDMPNIDKELLTKLINAFKAEPHFIHVTKTAESINALLAIYNKFSTQNLLKYQGDSPKQFIKTQNYKTMVLSKKEGLNVNAPEDLPFNNFN